MASSQRLAEWLLDHSSRLGLEVTALTWPRDWQIARLNDIHLALTFDGQQFAGRGTAVTSEEALSKAAGEAVERAFTKGHGIHSTGVALHTSASEAEFGARRELIERSTFFAHFYGRKPFLRLGEESSAELRRRYEPFFRKAGDAKIKIEFYTSAFHVGFPFVLCVAEGLEASNPWGGALGLAAKDDLASAVEGAFFECARSVANNILRDPPRLNLAGFLGLAKPSSLDRQKLSASLEYWSLVLHLFPKHETESSPQQRAMPALAIHKLPCPFPEINDAPVIAFRASPPGDADIHNSDPRQDPALLDWLTKLSGWEFRIDDLPTYPHFLG